MKINKNIKSALLSICLMLCPYSLNEVSAKAVKPDADILSFTYNNQVLYGYCNYNEGDVAYVTRGTFSLPYQRRSVRYMLTYTGSFKKDFRAVYTDVKGYEYDYTSLNYSNTYTQREVNTGICNSLQ